MASIVQALEKEVEEMEKGVVDVEKAAVADVAAVENVVKEEAAAIETAVEKEVMGAEEKVADHEKEWFNSAEELGNGAIAKLYEHHEVNWLALRLLRGHCVFSRDWKSDLWLHMKNKQPFISIFLAHPRHPFRRRERLMAVSVSCLLAWGMEAWFCKFWSSCDEHPEKDIISLFIQVLLLKIVVSAVVNGVYDAVMEQAFTCACVQVGCSDIVKNLCEKLSLVQFFIQLAIAVAASVFGAIFLIVDENGNWKDIGTATKEMITGKLIGLLGVTMALELVGFYFGRRSQMKPIAGDEAAMKKWDASAPSKLWNRFVGKDKTFDDLPAAAPTYDIDVKICGKVLYSERKDNPSAIPCCFKRRKAAAVVPAEVKPDPAPP